ncbi:lipopolysaccharide biosynthesis protein [Nitrosopumilus sp. S6]
MTDIWGKIKKIVFRTEDLQYIGLANVATKAIGGLFWFFVASLMEADVYGQISYIIAIAMMGMKISSIGSNQTIIVLTAKKIAIQPVMFLVVLITGSIAAIILFFTFEDNVISVYLLGGLIFELGISSLLGYKFYKKYSIYLIAQKILSVILALSLFFLIGPNGIVLGIGLSFLILLPRIIIAFKNERIQFSILREKFRFTMHNYGLSIEKILNGQIDKIIIVPLLGFVSLGNFSLGFQVLSVLLIIPSIAFTYNLPRDASGLPTKRLKIIAVIISIIFAILGMILAPILIPYFFPKYEDAVQIIQILSVSVIPTTITGGFVSYYLGHEKTKTVLIAQAITIISYIVGIYTLGEIYGIIGVSIAFVMSTIFQTVYYTVIWKIKKEQI